MSLSKLIWDSTHVLIGEAEMDWLLDNKSKVNLRNSRFDLASWYFQACSKSFLFLINNINTGKYYTQGLCSTWTASNCFEKAVIIYLIGIVMMRSQLQIRNKNVKANYSFEIRFDKLNLVILIIKNRSMIILLLKMMAHRAFKNYLQFQQID